MSTAFKCDRCGQFKIGTPAQGFAFGSVLEVLKFPAVPKDFCIPCLLKLIIEIATTELERIKATK
jgi:hypothetical protein